MKGKEILLMLSASLVLAGMPALASEINVDDLSHSKVAEEIVDFSQYQNASSNSNDSAEGFVSRLYQLVLGRQPDAGGLNAWTSQLVSGQSTGAQVANGFIYSTELKGRNLSNSDYVEMLYQTFLNRPSDAAGKASWVNLLEKGMSREYVYKGFANSTEFQKICDSYGIQRGEVVLTAPKDQNQGVTMFIYRCYEKFLGRKADDAGLNDWANELLTGRINAKEAAKGFVLSPEFQQKNLSNTDYVKTLYRGLFDREADSKGLSEWKAHLDAGNSREAVFYGFADSDEFRKLAASFGLNSSWAGTPVTYKANYEEIVEVILDNEDMLGINNEQPIKNMPSIQVVDFNFDGIPELVVEYIGGTMGNRPAGVYTVENGNLVSCGGFDNGNLTLYYNTKSQEKVFVANAIRMDGVAYIEQHTFSLKWVNGDIQTYPLLCEIASDRNYTGNFTYTYFIDRDPEVAGSLDGYYNNDNYKQISKEEYEANYHQYFENLVDLNMTHEYITFSEWNRMTRSEKRAGLLRLFENFHYDQP